MHFRRRIRFHAPLLPAPSTLLQMPVRSTSSRLTSSLHLLQRLVLLAFGCPAILCAPSIRPPACQLIGCAGFNRSARRCRNISTAASPSIDSPHSADRKSTRLNSQSL